MRTSRNPGLLAVTVGVGLAVLFGLLGGTGVLDGRVGFGLAVIVVTAAALVYIFYSRGNNVEKTGYGALLFVVAVAFIIPLLIVNQQQTQASAAKQQYDQTLLRGATLFGQYCAPCHGFQGQGLAGPKLNNNPTVNKFTNDDITRIISGGVPAQPASPTNFSGGMPAWSTTYGGALTPDDINYLVALIRSSDKDYIATNNLPETTNGFSYVLGTLTNPTQIAEYHKELLTGSKPTDFADLTSQTAVTIEAVSSTTNASGYQWQAVGQTTADIIIKVGTTVTWTNKSSAPHNVFSGPSGAPDGKFQETGTLAPNSTDTFTFTFTSAGDYQFFCAIHPAMIGWITVQA
jgi:plastocyanin/mono/diheme cytochrome c family protein